MLSNPQVNILLVDDRPENLLALAATLECLGQNLVQATSGEAALKHLLTQDFAVVLLDVQMPELDGFETAQLIRSRFRNQHTPIIFLTAFSTSPSFVFKGYSVGAVDYLIKPIVPEVLLSKVAVFIELFQLSAELKAQAEQIAYANIMLRQEIGRRQQVEVMLQRKQKEFSAIFQAISDAIIFGERKGLITLTNPAFTQIFGYSFEEIEKKQFNFYQPNNVNKHLGKSEENFLSNV